MRGDLAARLAPFRADPAASAVVTDFDGTLAAIVEDPDGARAAPEVVELLHRLARRYGCVAVLSGRPASFLAGRLDLDAHPPALRAIGLYGLEEAVAGGDVRRHPGVERWVSAVETAAARGEAELDPAVHVERKGLSVTFHWRQAPTEAIATAGLAARLAGELGLEIRPGRMAAELAPPVPVDKGTALLGLCEGRAAALYVGDDVGDVPALHALARLHTVGGAVTLGVAVASDEAPPGLLEAADAVVDGVAGAVELLGALDEA